MALTSQGAQLIFVTLVALAVIVALFLSSYQIIQFYRVRVSSRKDDVERQGQNQVQTLPRFQQLGPPAAPLPLPPAVQVPPRPVRPSSLISHTSVRTFRTFLATCGKSISSGERLPSPVPRFGRSNEPMDMHPTLKSPITTYWQTTEKSVFSDDSDVRLGAKVKKLGKAIKSGANSGKHGPESSQAVTATVIKDYEKKRIPIFSRSPSVRAMHAVAEHTGDDSPDPYRVESYSRAGKGKNKGKENTQHIAMAIKKNGSRPKSTQATAEPSSEVLHPVAFKAPAISDIGSPVPDWNSPSDLYHTAENTPAMLQGPV